MVARRAHNPKVVGSSPAPATTAIHQKRLNLTVGPFFCYILRACGFTIKKRAAARLTIPSCVIISPPLFSPRLKPVPQSIVFEIHVSVIWFSGLHQITGGDAVCGFSCFSSNNFWLFYIENCGPAFDLYGFRVCYDCLFW